ncbi:molybdopterin-dependent oxidoreductase [Ferrimonas lipolytica]|uniref:Molybdopterin-dependent oxidoreductase n=1 Tax=Ferrimonas lipolytica TaxID=2724191 RepID=A0A6H1UES9_9GAMM|nr:molybdopterin-dependent oxidoreductase [Ferrimonas lipolytica]QIZ76302.1 molybdopterin-dependent oxidoreductase [Ferrimonas lipolytica]
MQRRDFLKLSAATGTVSCVTACGSKSNDEPVPTIPEVAEVETLSACEANCAATCAFKVISQDGVLKRVEQENFYEDGFDIRQHRPCAKGLAAFQKIYSPDRIQNPLKRVGPRGYKDSYVEISWDQAFDEIAEKLTAIYDNYGPRAVLNGGGSNYGGSHSGFWVTNLLSAAGGCITTFGAMSFAQVARIMGHVFGGFDAERDFSSVVEMQNSDFILSFGFNPLETAANGSGMGFEYNHVVDGKPLIIFDPRYTDSCLGREQEFHFVRPGTDAALIEGMAYHLIENNLINETYLREKCYGFFAEDEMVSPHDSDRVLPAVSEEDSYRGHILGLKDGIAKTPAWAAKISGVPESTIKSTAEKLAAAKSPFVVAGWGMQRQFTGEDNVRSVTTLALMVGAVGNRGNSTGELPDSKGYLYPIPPLVANPIACAVPVHGWPRLIREGETMTVLKDNIRIADDDLDANGDGVIGQNTKAIFVRGGNPFNQQCDSMKIRELLTDPAEVELIVTIDTHLTPSMYVNDYILPDSTMYEREDFPATNMDNGAMGFLIATQGIPPIGNVKSTFEICLEIAKKMGIDELYSSGCSNDEEALVATYNFTRMIRPDLHPYMPETWAEMKEKQMVKWARPVEDTDESARWHVGYWDYVQYGTEPLNTPTGKIDIYSHDLQEYSEKSEIPEYWPKNSGGYINATPKFMIGPESYLDSSETLDEFPLQLCGYHTKAQVHTQYQSTWVKEAMNPAAWVNPIDAAARSIVSGDMIEIESPRGKTQVEAKVTPRVMQGVVALGQGLKFNPEGGVCKGGSSNTLTSHDYSSPVDKACGVATCRINIRKL